MIDDDDDEIRRQDYERLFGTTAEREEEAREMAERQRQIDRDETLAWARELAAGREERLRREAQETAKGVGRSDTPTDELGRPLNDPRYRLAPEAVTKSYGASGVPAAVARDWPSYIKRQLDQRDRSLTKAIAAVVVAEETQRKQIDAEILAKLDVLTTQIEELRERLDKIEAASKAAPLRVVG